MCRAENKKSLCLSSILARKHRHFFSRVTHSEVPRLFFGKYAKTKSSVRACEKKQYGASAAGGMMTHAREVWHY